MILYYELNELNTYILFYRTFEKTNIKCTNKSNKRTGNTDDTTMSNNYIS